MRVNPMMSLLMRHGTTLISAITIGYGAAVYIAQPRAEEFVRKTVKSQFDQQTMALKNLETIVGQNTNAVASQARETKAVKDNLKDLKQSNERIINILITGRDKR